MKELTNEISKKFVEDKYNELVNNDLPLTSLRKIEHFMNKELNVINENLLEKLVIGKSELYARLDKMITDNQTTITKLNSQIKDYEADLDTLEKLKTFKRKSKFLR